MATREEIIEGLQFTVAQAKRTTGLWPDSEWDAERPVGWTPKQIYCHLAATAKMIPQMAQALSGAPEDADLAGGMNIDTLNEAAVQSMAAMTPEQVMQTFEANYQELIEYLKTVPDDVLTMKRSFLSDPIPVSDIVASAVMLHGIHHVYEANSRTLG